MNGCAACYHLSRTFSSFLFLLNLLNIPAYHSFNFIGQCFGCILVEMHLDNVCYLADFLLIDSRLMKNMLLAYCSGGLEEGKCLNRITLGRLELE